MDICCKKPYTPSVNQSLSLHKVLGPDGKPVNIETPVEKPAVDTTPVNLKVTGSLNLRALIQLFWAFSPDELC